MTLDLSFYGDDFTGSTDVMEALSSNGLPTVLFTRLPTKAQRAAFPDARAVGLAGTSRSQSPDWMDANLPAIYAWLRGLGARHCHYKTCSTFDSAPHIGNIGRATELGLAAFDQTHAHIVVGAPQLRRYTMFGTLFASYQSETYRIDRHPVMSRHPATPMAEADLCRHLGPQTALQTGTLNPDTLRATTPLDALHERRAAGDVLTLIDVWDAASQTHAGQLIEDTLSDTGPFIVGSSGVEYALIQAWRATGRLPEPPAPEPLGPEHAIAVVSGSCSPTTGRQIETALAHGFTGIALDYTALASGQGAETLLSDAFGQASAALRAGTSPLVYTARGHSTATLSDAANDRVGRALGKLLNDLMTTHPLRRVVVAGGDTSSHALSELDTYALTLRRPLPETPGSPVCRAHRDRTAPFEIALKGGQVGSDSYFVTLRDGL